MGINPEKINSKVQPINPIYNFAITEIQSSFGEIYYKGIQKKLDKTSNNSIFIIAADPWSISIDNRIEIENKKYKEQGSTLDKVKNINQNPNLQYLFQTYSLSWGSIFINMAKDNDKPDWTPQKNGWLKVNASYDSTTFMPRIYDKIKSFREYKMPNFEFSPNRYSYLEKTIQLLQKHGNVFLVRIPVFPEIRDIEKEYMPDFDNKIELLANKYGIKYFNQFDCNQFDYYDGHHLIGSSANKFSMDLATIIKNVTK